MELYRKYRPCSFDEVKGQFEAVGVLKGWLAQGNVPHAIMLAGQSGAGKTTLARILANELGAKPPLDYTEINVAEERGIGMVYDLSEQVRQRPITGKNRVWVLDEVHALLKAPQNALLKILEEAPEYAYFVLCTTDPEKTITTVKNRCSRIAVKPIDDKAIGEIIDRVVQAEGREIPDEVRSKIIEYAEGSGRKALTKLGTCLAAQNPVNMLALIQQEEDLVRCTKDLCEIFTGSKQATWRETAKIFDAIPDEAESIRRALLGWLASALTRGWAKGNVPDALLANCIRILQYHTYDSGKPQLLLMVYDCYQEMQKCKQAQNRQ